MHTSGYRTIALSVAVLMLSSCAAARDYLQDYRGHPQARVHCAGYLEKSVTAKTDVGVAVNQSEGDTPKSTTQTMGKTASRASLPELKDKKGSIYDACIEAWELQAAQREADRVRSCTAMSIATVIFIPLIPFCPWGGW